MASEINKVPSGTSLGDYWVSLGDNPGIVRQPVGVCVGWRKEWDT